jgi:hypothetical protein
MRRAMVGRRNGHFGYQQPFQKFHPISIGEDALFCHGMVLLDAQPPRLRRFEYRQGKIGNRHSEISTVTLTVQSLGYYTLKSSAQQAASRQRAARPIIPIGLAGNRSKTHCDRP